MGYKKKLIIEDRINNAASKRMDFTILKQLCEEYKIWPSKIVIRRPDKEELEEDETYAGGKYYYGGDEGSGAMHYIFPYGYEIKKLALDLWQAHEFRHMMVDKFPYLASIINNPDADKLRGILVAIVTFSSPGALVMMEINKNDIRDLDPEEIDANTFAAMTVKKKLPKRIIKKFKEKTGANKNENSPPVSSAAPSKPIRWR